MYSTFSFKLGTCSLTVDNLCMKSAKPLMSVLWSFRSWKTTRKYKQHLSKCMISKFRILNLMQDLISVPCAGTMGNNYYFYNQQEIIESKFGALFGHNCYSSPRAFWEYNVLQCRKRWLKDPQVITQRLPKIYCKAFPR